MASGGEEVSEVLADFYPLLDKNLSTRLASKLGCTEAMIMNQNESHESAQSIAKAILTNWKGHAPPNQRSTLGDAFLAVERRDLYNLLQKSCDLFKEKNQGGLHV